ncbi:MAG: hypothetical protein GX911_03795 [Spirochaetales bacterium]|nr:hypothetical protein [Spirochaetales bacterium]
MQTRSDRFCLRLPRLFLLPLFFILLLGFSGCREEEFDVLNVESSLSALYFLPEGESASILTLSFELTSDDSVVEVQVSSPDATSRWVVSAKRDEGGRFTVGPLSMGKGNTLAEGVYSMVILNERGKTIDRTVAVRSPDTSVDPFRWGSFDPDTRTLVLKKSATLQVGNDHVDLKEGESHVFAVGEDEFYLSFDRGATIVRVTL